jgi:disulfide oxidoreductase YuzD
METDEIDDDDKMENEDSENPLVSIDESVLSEGREHEMEHTDDPEEAEEIAMDHFKEHGEVYYPVLNVAEEFMEKIKGMPKTKQDIYLKKLGNFVNGI